MGDHKGRPYKGAVMKEYLMRKPLRLKGWDYTASGVYFITFCTQDRLPVLSSIRRGDLLWSPAPDPYRPGDVC